MPSSRHARMTRMAISPRLATRTFLKSLLFNPLTARACSSFDSEQRLARGDDLALFHIALAAPAGNGGDDVVLHLHRLQLCNHVADPHLFARLVRELDDQAL